MENQCRAVELMMYFGGTARNFGVQVWGSERIGRYLVLFHHNRHREYPEKALWYRCTRIQEFRREIGIRNTLSLRIEKARE